MNRAVKLVAMSGLEIFAKGALFGLGAAIPIGPVNVELLRRALSQGWRAGVCLGLGAVSVDVVYACIAVTATGLGGLAEVAWVFWGLAVGSAVLLGYLGWGSMAAGLRAYREKGESGVWGATEARKPERLTKIYFTGVAMTAVNPMTLVFWFVSLPGQAMTQGIGGGQLAYLAGGVFTGTVAWVLGFSTVIAVLGRWRKPWWVVAADVVGGLVLWGFAAVAVVAMVRRAVG